MHFKPVCKSCLAVIISLQSTQLFMLYIMTMTLKLSGTQINILNNTVTFKKNVIIEKR